MTVMTIRRSVLAAQATASLGLAAGGAAGGLLAVALTGDPATAASPLGALVLGAGLSAPAAAAVMTRVGRLSGLAAGYLTAMLGAVLVVVAAATASLPWLLAGNLLFGAGNTAVMLSRYVIADVSPPQRRGRAISVSLLTITLGAIAGPNLLGPTSPIAEALGLPAPAGLYLVAIVAFLVSPMILIAARRKLPVTPSDPTRRRRVHTPTATPTRSARSPANVLIAFAVLTTANVTMVAVMAVAPVHLHAHGHALGLVGMVVSFHVAAMYVTSPVLGRLCDRHGPSRLAAGGAALFVLAAVTPLMVGTARVEVVTGLLVLLGVAWNVQIVAGSTMLALGVPASLRPRLEGRGELAMSMGAAAGSLLLARPLAAAGGITLLALANVPLHAGVLVLLRTRRAGLDARVTEFVPRATV
jgi:MFS family permease